MNKIKLVESHLKEVYDFRYNCITDTVEYNKKHTSTFSTVNDIVINSLFRELNKAGIDISCNTVATILKSDFSVVYNPFTEYFCSLQQWNNAMPDYITQLADTVTTNNTQLWELYLKKWLVAAVACAMDNNITNQTALILVGQQGIGKGTFLKNLVPEPLASYYCHAPLNLDSKDFLVQLAESFIINIDELDSLNKSDIAKLKEAITKPSMRIRRVWGKVTELLPRRASFCGSLNEEKFLYDTTGSRRFLVSNILSIDNSVLIDMDMVYAQAYYLWKTGFQYWFDESEQAIINSSNEQFRSVSMEEDALVTYFEPGSKTGEGCEFMTSTQILTALHKLSALSETAGTVNVLGKVLKSKGFERSKFRGVWGYWVKEVKQSIFPIDSSKIRAVS